MYKISKIVWASKMVWASKTAIAKTTAKITTTALLFFLLLFTLTTNLKAQAVQDNSKSGFFAGFVILDGFQVDSNKSITASGATAYKVSYSNEINEIRAYAHPIYATSDLRHIIETLLKANCETGATDVIIDNINTAFSLTQLDSFDEGSETGEFSSLCPCRKKSAYCTNSITCGSYGTKFTCL